MRHFIDPLDWFLGLQLPQSFDSKSIWILECKATLLIVLVSGVLQSTTDEQVVILTHWQYQTWSHFTGQ